MSLNADWSRCPELPEKLSPNQANLVQVVAIGMAIVGVRIIMERDLLDTAARFVMAQRVGGSFAKTKDGQSMPVTIDHLRICMGLQTNVKPMPRSTFLAQTFRAVLDEIKHEEKEGKRVQEEAEAKIREIRDAAARSKLWVPSSVKREV